MAKQMFFGQEAKFQMVPAPATGMQVSRSGYSETLEYQNGRAGIVRSMQTHKTYSMDFPVQEATGQGGLDVFAKYSSGYYGDLDSYPIFFADPMYYDQNLMPENWAAPGLYARGWEPIVYGFRDSITYQNVATNPGVEVNATGYSTTSGTGGSATGGRTTASAYRGSYSYRATWGTGTSAVSGGVNYTGTTYFYNTGGAVVWVQCSKIQRVQLTMRFRDASNVSLGTATSTQTVLAANTWTKLTAYASSLPAGTVTVDLEVAAVSGTSGTNWAASNWLAIDSVAIYGNDIYTDSFDGDTPGARWVGTRGSSVSQMTKSRLRASVSTTSAPVLDLPPQYVTYDVTSIPNAFPTTNEQYGNIPYVVIPIPPGYTLHFGWTGAVTGTAQMVLQPMLSGPNANSFGTIQTPTPSALQSSTRLTNTVAASSTVDYVKIYIRRTTTDASTITIESITAQLWPTGYSPTTTGRFIEGKGHRGLKFEDDAVAESYVMVDPNRPGGIAHLKGLSTSLTEAQDRG